MWAMIGLTALGLPMVAVAYLPGTLESSTVVRSFDSGSCYAPEVTVEVTIQVVPEVGTLYWGLEDQPPAGWTLVADSIDPSTGRWDARNRKVKWLFENDAPQTLKYRVTPPAEASGDALFAGAASFGGVHYDISGTSTLHIRPSMPTDVQAVPASVCPGDLVTLSATTGPSDSIDWFTGGCGGTLVATGSSIQINPTMTTTYYARARSSEGCDSLACAEVTVTVLLATPDIANSDRNDFCADDSGSISLSVTGGSGDTVRWFDDSCGGREIGTGSPLVIDSPTVTTTYYARWENTCGVSACASVTVTVRPLAVAPDVANSDRNDFCEDDSGSISLSVTGGSGDTVRWFDDSCGGHEIGTGSPLVVDSPTVTTTYYARWENTCGVSACASVTVTVRPLAVAPDSASSDRNDFCADDSGSISLSVTGGSGDTVRWFDDSCGGREIGTGNPLVIDSPMVTTTYYARWETSCNVSTCVSVEVAVNTGHPADINHDWQLVLDEVTAYGAAWKTPGSVWPVPPSPIPADYVTKAGAMWMDGEVYHCVPESSGMCPSSCWAPDYVPGMMAMTSANDLHAASTDWTATRTVGAQQYIPGQSIQICINVSPAAATRVYVVEETPPAGWTVRNVNEKGVWDSITGHIRWGMFWDSNPRQLCYELIPPTVAGKDGQFAGIASYDGMVVLITGDSSIESGFSMTSAVSRRSHGAAGPFDISMPLGGDGAGVECRAGSSLSLVLTFSRPVAPGVGSASDGVLSDGPADDQKTLTVSNVQDVSCLALILNDVTDNDGAPLMGPDRLVVAQLAGDVNADQVVNVVDLLMIRSRMNLPLATDGFRMDVNADGRINVVDLLVARANVNRSLAGTCP